MRHVRALCFVATAWTVLFAATSSQAVTDYVWFSVNGDTSATSMIQGDTLGWGSNCAVGASVRWGVWIDANANTTLDTLADKSIASFVITDGEIVSNDGPPDTHPVPDGLIVTPPAELGVAPAYYFFKATDLTDFTFAARGMNVDPLPSPPNKFTGTVTIPGYAPPDPFLAFLWVEASEEVPNGNFWSGLTDASGAYEINVGAAGSGALFRIGVPELPGFVTPVSQNIVASGLISGVNFAYQLPADSVYGTIEDEFGTPILSSVNVWARLRAAGGASRQNSTSTGSYAVYFAASDAGEWEIGIDRNGLVPSYVVPNDFSFDYTGAGSTPHNFVCYTADTVLYVKVTELGAAPAHAYRFSAWSQDNLGSTIVVSDTGAGNVVALHVSSQGALWNVSLDTWDSQYPVPAGWALEAGSGGTVGLGDTAVFNFITGHLVQDTIKVDPGDPVPAWQEVWTYMYSSGASYNVPPDGNGVFTLYADTGTYSLSANAIEYLAGPTMHTVHVTGDTVGGMGFTLNYKHAVIRGNVSAPGLMLGSNLWISGSTCCGPINYGAAGHVDSATGDYSIEVCDGDWTIYPPYLPGYEPLGPVGITIGDTPDTVTQDFFYTLSVGVGDDGTVPDVFELKQNYPNPFNAGTRIDFVLPRPGRMQVAVYNVLGQPVRTLCHDVMNAGPGSLLWDGDDEAGRPVASGLYFYRVRFEGEVTTKRMLLLR